MQWLIQAEFTCHFGPAMVAVMSKSFKRSGSSCGSDWNSWGLVWLQGLRQGGDPVFSGQVEGRWMGKISLPPLSQCLPHPVYCLRKPGIASPQNAGWKSW